MKIELIVCATIVGLLPPAAAAQSQTRSALGGRNVIVQLRVGTMRGELIAVTTDSIWVLQNGQLEATPTRQIRQVKVDREVLGTGMNWTWSLAAGAGSGLALTLACSTVSSGCGGVFLVTVAIWTAFGGISAHSMAASRYETIRNWQHLAPYARFPQGLPEGVGEADLLAGRARYRPGGRGRPER